ncbi:hypothetical protein ACWEBX_41335, partial [Streptomyces sp. NPDC005070]
MLARVLASAAALGGGQPSGQAERVCHSCIPEDERPVPIVLFVDEVAELFLVATRKDEERR